MTTEAPQKIDQSLLDSEAEPLIRVSGGTPVKDLAGAITNQLSQGKLVRVRAIGAAAVNQAVKAIAISGGHMGAQGQSVNSRIGFVTLHLKGEDVSSIVFRLQAA